jgi:hypothetical protein
MKNLPNVNSNWIDNKSTIFRIKKLENKDSGVWVYYQNEKTDQQYNCLVDAFLARFKEQLS